MKDDEAGNPLLQATPESEALFKRLVDGMTPEDKDRLAADLRERAEELERQRDPEIREQMAENHRQQVREINRQTMIDQARQQAAEIKRSDMH